MWMPTQSVRKRIMHACPRALDSDWTMHYKHAPIVALKKKFMYVYNIIHVRSYSPLIISENLDLTIAI